VSCSAKNAREPSRKMHITISEKFSFTFVVAPRPGSQDRGRGGLGGSAPGDDGSGEIAHARTALLS
jgi:hypothetical protein